jgi:hypothetical protein
VLWYPYIIESLGELIYRLVLFAFQFCEVEFADEVTIKCYIFSLDHRAIAIDSHYLMVVGD